MEQRGTDLGEQGKIVYLELLRVIACFFVIVNHTASGEFLALQPGGRKWFVLIVYFFISKTAVPVYLMISGTLLLRRTDGYRKCGRRILRIVLDIVIFSFVYYLRSWYVNGMSFDLIEYFKLIYQRNITNAYWYLYLYLGILVMLPLLQRLSAQMGRREYIYLILISVVFLGLMPILIHYWEGLKYDAAFSVPFFSVFTGLLFLGYFLNRYVEVRWQYAVVSLVVLTACIAFLTAATYLEYKRTPEDYLFFDERTFLPITMASAAVFYLVRWFASVVRGTYFWRGVTFLGSCSFGTYLLSDFFLEVYEKVYQTQLLPRMNVLIALLIYELLILLTGFAVTAGLRCIPYVKKLL